MNSWNFRPTLIIATLWGWLLFPNKHYNLSCKKMRRQFDATLRVSFTHANFKSLRARNLEYPTIFSNLWCKLNISPNGICFLSIVSSLFSQPVEPSIKILVEFHWSYNRQLIAQIIWHARGTEFESLCVDSLVWLHLLNWWAQKVIWFFLIYVNGNWYEAN